MYKTAKLYYDNITGESLYFCSYNQAITINFDHDYNVLKVLNEREKDSIGLLILENGQYYQDFREGRLMGVNLDTLVPIFEYPNPDNPDEPIVTESPLTKQVAELSRTQLEQDELLMQLLLGGA